MNVSGVKATNTNRYIKNEAPFTFGISCKPGTNNCTKSYGYLLFERLRLHIDVDNGYFSLGA